MNSNCLMERNDDQEYKLEELKDDFYIVYISIQW